MLVMSKSRNTRKMRITISTELKFETVRFKDYGLSDHSLQVSFESGTETEAGVQGDKDSAPTKN